MANIQLNPAPFIPPVTEIEERGIERMPRHFIILSGNPVHAHEEYVLAIGIKRVLHWQDHHGFLHHQVRDYIMQNLGLPVRSVCRHPLDIGLVQLDSTYHRDLLIAENIHDINGVAVRFIPHD
jgi:hypothetical protein